MYVRKRLSERGDEIYTHMSHKEFIFSSRLATGSPEGTSHVFPVIRGKSRKSLGWNQLAETWNLCAIPVHFLRCLRLASSIFGMGSGLHPLGPGLSDPAKKYEAVFWV